ncbi:hypothetical protein [Leptothrix discophora]|uniref:Uncharacterized protein n=1 Tax=Leptothrix discophora TaxID=89 RepID=A0ABT9G259_LEPDI|nr:hypothetical protein [Leptothrix discophora]MDP4300362.1 hypothetical protein [Leptothrix discophora]
MREYGKVYATFWSSDTTSTLTDDGKLLALYLMTCSHSTIAGVFRLPDGYVSEDLGWSSERVAQGFAELFAKGFANRCGTTKWVWICRHLEWNKPENPNQRKSAAKIAASVPDGCAWKPVFIEVCGPLLGVDNFPSVNPSGTVPKPLLNQEQEQKQEQKQEREQASERAAPPSTAPPSTAPPPAVAAEPAGPAGPATPAGLACRAMRAAGLTRVNPSDPRLVALLEQGVTVEELAAVAAEAVERKREWAWVLATVTGRRRDAAEVQLAPVVPPAVEQAARQQVVQTSAYLDEQREHAAAARSPESQAAARRAVQRMKGGRS